MPTTVPTATMSNCIRCRTVSKSMYCIDCDSSSNLFGCNGLRNASYCIFNTQYTQEEYETTVSTIIQQMQATGERGQFFDPSVSVFGYNQSIAAIYYPLSKSEALAQGYTRYEEEKKPAGPISTSAPDIHICETSGKPYRLMKGEITFYEKFGIPTPTLHPSIRHEMRISGRKPGM